MNKKRKAPIALLLVNDAPLWCLWLSLENAERAGYGQCANVRKARMAGERGAWIAFPSYAHAESVWRIATVSAIADLN